MPPGEPTVSQRAVRKRFGRYEVRRSIGSGGMGTVYLAYDQMLGREVAVKTCHARPGAIGEEFCARFLNEARCIAGLAHPNIVPVFDMGVDDEMPFMVMEVVHGASLKDKLKAGPMDVGEVRVIGIQIANALAAAHRANVVHRDVKPDNLLEAEPGVWKLVDFGIARTPDSSLTEDGTFLGTPAFSALETLQSTEFSSASDVYGLAATLYVALTGKLPHGDGSAVQIALHALDSPVPPVRESRPELSRSFASAIDRALLSDPRARPTAEAFAQLLAARGTEGVPAVAGKKSRAPWLLAGAALVAVVVVTLAVRGGGSGAADSPLAPGVGESGADMAAGDEAGGEVLGQADEAEGETDDAPAATGDATGEAAGAIVPGEPEPEIGPDETLEALLKKGSKTQAIRTLQRLQKTHSKSAYIPYQLGMLQLERMWWKDGFEALTVAIKRNPAYRSHEPLLRTSLRGLSSKSQAWRAQRFLVDVVGQPAAPYLKEVVAQSKNSKVRARATRSLAQIEK